jgi:uncharacterized protein YheU (UPF0270 family)
MSLSLVQSELVRSEQPGTDSADAPSLSQRVSELEEEVSRANAEILVGNTTHQVIDCSYQKDNTVYSVWL